MVKLYVFIELHYFLNGILELESMWIGLSMDLGRVSIFALLIVA